MCLEQHNEPRLLPCLHAFCTECLQGLLDEIPAGGKLSCPNCRRESDPPLSVEEFPLDHATQRAQEFRSFSQKAAEEKTGPCKNCEDEDEETEGYCAECGGGICGGCAQLHNGKMKAFRGHKFVQWDEVQETSFVPQRQKRKCVVHKELEVQLYCERCNCFICSVCLRERHVAHAERTKSLEDVREKRLAEVDEVRGKAEKQLNLLKQRQVELQQMEDGLTYYPKDLENSITSTFVEYMQRVKLWCSQKVIEAHEKHSEMAKNLSVQQSDTESAIDRLNTGLQFAGRAVTFDSDDAIIEMSTAAIDQLQCTMQGLDTSPPKRPLVFEKGNLQLGQLREIREGDIHVEPPNFCFMNSVNEITVKFEVPVHTRPQVRILYGSQKQRSVTLHPQEPVVVDSCKVSFFPRCAGKHTIEVWVGGAMCRRCDNVMVVRGAPENATQVKPGPDWTGCEEVITGTVLNSEQVQQLQRPAQVRLLEEVDGEEQESFTVKVQWDNGGIIDYEWGNNDEYELELVPQDLPLAL